MDEEEEDDEDNDDDDDDEDEDGFGMTTVGRSNIVGGGARVGAR